MNNPRKTPRAQWIDYDSGMYFITICTKNRFHFFGEVINGQMKLSRVGEIAAYELSTPGIHHPEIEIPLFVVMPNHIHAIVGINACNNDMASCSVPIEQRNPNPSFRANADMARHVPTLSKYVASFKSAVSRKARVICGDFGWQARYHEHLIRGNRDWNNISEYIVNNPSNWDKDCFFVPE